MALVQLAEEIIRRYGDHAPRLKSSGIDACGMKLVAKLLQRGTTRPCPRGREPLHILEKQPAMSADLVERHGTIVQQSGQELPGHAKEVRGSLGRHRLLARDHEDGPASLEVAGDHHDEREQLLRQRDLPAFGVERQGCLRRAAVRPAMRTSFSSARLSLGGSILVAVSMFGGEGGTQYLLYLQPVKSRPETEAGTSRRSSGCMIDLECIGRRIITPIWGQCPGPPIIHHARLRPFTPLPQPLTAST